MRRHATASSARSKARKPSGQGPSPSSRFRLTILLATVAAFLLVPAAQAAAAGDMHVVLAGSGSGEVTSAGGFREILVVGYESTGAYEGSPPIECSGPAPGSGICEDEMSEEEGLSLIAMYAEEVPGSEFVGWEVEAGITLAGCEGNEANPGNGRNYSQCFIATEGEDAEVIAVYECETEGGCGPSGPTNRAALTLTKSAGGTGGIGTVSSKPKGINCATACNEAVASMYKNTPVTLKEKPALGSTFVEWTGACSGSAETCTVPMAAAESVGAVFGGVSKAIINPTPLTVNKGEGSGFGTVKAAGLACEPDCSSATVLYQGPITGSKPKPGKLVELKEAPAYGSEFSGWSGACSGSEPVCKVTMEEAKTVTATFTAKPTTTLTVAKAGTGTGTVSSKPKAINCAATCTTQDATVPTGEAVILKEKPANEMTFTGWSGGGCSGSAETCTVSLSEATTVTATFSGSPKPIANAKALTLTKAGSGYGTVKATGLTCEPLCSSATALYLGPVTGSKPKPGKLVVLKAVSAPGSKAVAWSGCDSIDGEGNCVVTMETDREVTATFDELE